jgi:hypothetical protein
MRSFRTLLVVLAATASCGGVANVETKGSPATPTPASSLASPSVAVTRVLDSLPGPHSPLVNLRLRRASFEVGNDLALGPTYVKCLAGKGRRVTIDPPAPADERVIARYGGPHTDSDGLTRYGEPPPGKSGIEQMNRVHGATPEEYGALMGGQSGGEERTVLRSDGQLLAKIQVGTGCYSQGVTALFGSTATYLDFAVAVTRIDDLTTETGVGVWESVSVKPTVGDWVACMRRSGYSYEDPRVPARTDWKDPALDVKTASADKICRESIGFDAAFAAAEKTLQEQVVQKHPGLVEGILATMAAVEGRRQGLPTS